MIVEFDDIELKHPDAGGGNVYFYNGQPFSGTIVEHTNGVLVGEISVVNGSTHGRVVSYFNNGQLNYEYFQKFNQMYGIYKRWNENGILEAEVDYGLGECSINCV
ncbi:toxin-antitoxin system YwqK family antitoxin, partial [Flavobacterium sp. UBA6135]|uniref:toxin-antitoxin system YwqK family antitoxin n=1 Tax=Flavobacterium sp. UBA6135 TaxID=1946553 RepID=UPI0039C85462